MLPYVQIFFNFFLGIPGCYEYNIDYPGNDIGSCLTDKTIKECQEECQKNAQCRFWTSVGKGGCCLKTSKGTRTKKGDTVSGPRTCGKINLLYIFFFLVFII